MSFKLTVKERIPLVIYMGKERILFEMQINTLKPDGNFRGYFFKYAYMDKEIGFDKIGACLLNLLEEYHAYGDLTQLEVFNMTGMLREEHNRLEEIKELEYAGVKDLHQLYHQYLRCSIKYLVYEKKYIFTLSLLQHKGRDYNYETCSSAGKENLLTFDTPLEFDASISPEALGSMILEAFDRCQQLADASEGKRYEVKKIELLDDSILEVQAPRDKRFSDAEDIGAAEVYQVYEYYPREDSDSAQAVFYLGIGAELNCDLSEENIRAAWERLYGTADYFEWQKLCCGIFCLRAEMRNSTIHRVSYFLPLEESLILECAMEVYQAGKRKKLDEKLSGLFEEFAGRCRRKQK